MLIELVNETSKTKTFSELNLKLKTIQNCLGVRYGDLAGNYFVDFFPSWSDMSERKRKEILIEYINRELAEVVNN